MVFKPLNPVESPAATGKDDNAIPVELNNKETVTLKSAEDNLFAILDNIIHYLKSNHLDEIAGTEKVLAYNQMQGILFQIAKTEHIIKQRIAQNQPGDKTNV